MSFARTPALASLLAVAALAGLYVWQLRRRRRQAVRFSAVSLVREALGPHRAMRRHVPVVLFLAALAGLGVAAARPQVSEAVPSSQTSIILALDVSLSMCATDVEPNRLTAAQEAARAFIEDQAGASRIGIVAFAGFSELVVAPTDDTERLLDAVDGLTTARGTAIGAAMLKAIDAVAEVNPEVAPTDDTHTATTPTAPGAAPTEPPPGAPPSGAGDYVADIVVLLTDGANTRGVDPLTAAEQAADRRVRVYTIGFGTEDPIELACSRAQLGADAFGDGFGGFGGGGLPSSGLRRVLQIDEETLSTVAGMTGGEYFRAESADQLNAVFERLPARVEVQHRDREVASLFALASALVLVAALALSLAWVR